MGKHYESLSSKLVSDEDLMEDLERALRILRHGSPSEKMEWYERAQELADEIGKRLDDRDERIWMLELDERTRNA